MFEDISRTRWTLVAEVVLIEALLLVIIVFFVIPLVRLPGIISSLLWLSVAVAIIIGQGKLHHRDLGWRKEAIVPGILVFFAIWGILQVIGLILCEIQFGTLPFNPLWAQSGILLVLYPLFSQIFGNTLYEESVFRGFLLPQFYLLMNKKPNRVKRDMLFALLVSNSLFSAEHIPIRLISGYPLIELPFNLFIQGLIGILFSLVYLRTKNLFITMGIHSLWNTPTWILNVDAIGTVYFSAAQWMLIPITGILIVFWSKIVRFTDNQRSQKTPSSGFAL